MRPTSAYATNRQPFDPPHSSARPFSAVSRTDRTKRQLAWSPIMIESINPNSYHVASTNNLTKSKSKGTIFEIEKDQDINDKINLQSRNLFTCLSLPHDQVSNLNYSNNYISKIDKIDHLKHLSYLDFSDNRLEDLSGLPNTPSLRLLMAGKNRIAQISNLNIHSDLDVLDLSVNLIQEISGLDNLQNLRILNLESNNIEILPDISYLVSLVELNLKKNQISRISVLKNMNLKTLMLNSNMIQDIQYCDNLINCNQLMELYMDGNPVCNDQNYRSFVVVRLKYLRFLDGRRINEEERRNCARLEKRASERRMEAEKVLQKDLEKKSVLEKIQNDWENRKGESYIYPSEKKNGRPKSSLSLKRPSKPILSSQIFENGYYQLVSGQLKIFGNALSILETIEPVGITGLSFHMIHIEDILRFHPLISKFKSVVKISFDRTMISHLNQFNLFTCLDIHEIYISIQDNPITLVQMIKNYLIFRFANLSIYNDSTIVETDRNKAWIQFGSLRQMISLIPPRLLSKNQIKNFPMNNRKKSCFEDFQSDNESAESESVDGMIASYTQIPSAKDLIMSALSLKQKLEQFEIEWQSMINQVLINHDI